MAANKGSFAQRVASMASNNMESWDDDGDLQGDLYTHSMSTIHSQSSRVSVRSESNTCDDDWQVLIAPNDENSTINAISSAKHAGIPIPTSVPSSALLGGSIKRLGKKKSSRKIAVDDDWGDDLELPTSTDGGLKLKLQAPTTPADEEHDDFDDWGEGSLGIRFGGTRREARGGRSSSVSAMSPSLGSCMTVESEDDDLTGLVLPNEPLDFNARLEKLKKIEIATPDASPVPARRDAPPTSAPAPQLAPSPFAPSPLTPSPAIASVSSPPIASEPVRVLEPEQKLKAAEEDDDFFDGLEFGPGEALDTKKLTLNRNVVVKKPSSKPAAPTAARPAATLTFTDKPSASRIPRPLPSTSRSRLTPVYETGAPSNLNNNRPMPTTTSAQLLRAKRSAPVLRSNNNFSSVPRPPVPFLPAGGANAQSHHVTSKTSQPRLRGDSDPRQRPQSPLMRPWSRMSSLNAPDTPSRSSTRGAMTSFANRALAKTVTKPAGPRRVYGDGSELEIFDDLPTSATKEKQFERAPKNLGQTARTVRQKPSITKLPIPDRMTTPAPQTPRSPTKVDSTPRFARDTAASRIAREQRLAGTRSRGEGPIPPTNTNWKAQVAARSPHNSPTAQRKRGTGQRPMLIKGMSQGTAKYEKGMTYNPMLQRWEGNEDALISFSHHNTSTTTLALTTASTPTFAPPTHPLHSHDRSHSISHTALSTIQAAQKNVSSRAVKVQPAPSPPRLPALISQKSGTQAMTITRGMVFDPQAMKWLKLPRGARDPLSPSVDGDGDDDDEEDPFAGLDDLKDNEATPSFGGGVTGVSNKTGGLTIADPNEIGEEFDVGPSFIRKQREEEAQWRRKVEKWVGGIRDTGEQRGGWRWSARELALRGAAEHARNRR
ncbi:hypothetical protein BDV96DRAFT_367514 [Lophiotrema nucula]|uniref:Cytokinesis regulator n=1 Tax=Lophiotrema nucula TaxID=690887 RepID=A0A6A5ZHH1_9PLEO|nr:hypothetical protein BDV96DRAFT_367514 [Lophiotrema nucula]